MLHQHDATFFISKVSLLSPLHYLVLNVCTLLSYIVNLHLVVLNFLDYCVIGAEKAG